MTTETVVTQTAEEKALATQGATKDNLDPGSSGSQGAPKAPPAPSNEPPPKKEGLDETNTVVVDPVEKAKADAAAKAAKDKADEEAKEAAGPLKSYAVITDSPAAAAAIDLLKEAGVGPNAANEFFEKALKSGDPKDVDVAGLTAKIGAAKATLVMAGVNAHFAEAKAKGEATVKVVHDIFGGDQNWTTVRDWAHAAEKADPKIKVQIDSIRSLIDEGGPRAEAGARELLRMYNAAPQTKGLGTSKLAVGDTSGNVIGAHLSRADYNTELKAAHARGAKPAEIAALDARRRAGMKAGI
jgi:hypothetical protein